MRAFVLPLLLLGSAACDAQAPAGDAQPRRMAAVEAPARTLPALTGRIVDQAELLDPKAEAALTERLAALEKATSDQLVVVTTPGLGGEGIKDYGMRLGNGWGIGQKGLDNGVLLIVAPADRQARIAVGKGLEGLLTDERAARIMDQLVIPNCREGRCERAVTDGVAAIDKLLRSDPKRPRPKSGAA